ncbi:hypothetical protein D3C78_1690710 [compost metagenome]
MLLPFKTLDQLLGLVPADAVGLLKPARQRHAFAGNHVKTIVGQIAPLGFHLAPEFPPVSFYPVPVHYYSFRMAPEG